MSKQFVVSKISKDALKEGKLEFEKVEAVAMSICQNHGAYIVEDTAGDLYCISIGAAASQDLIVEDLPEISYEPAFTSGICVKESEENS